MLLSTTSLSQIWIGSNLKCVEMYVDQLTNYSMFHVS